MATQKQAKIARDQYFDYLSEMGAHTLAIDSLNKKKNNDFAIVAFVEGDTGKIPDELEINHEGKITKVPVVIEHSEKFKPQ